MAEKTNLPDIYKAHQAVAILPAQGSRITLLMRRFFNVLLQHAQHSGAKETYQVEFSNVLGDAGYTSNNFEVAKGVLRSMANTTVEWNIVNEKPDSNGVVKDWGITTLLSHARVVQMRNRLLLEWSYSPVMRQEILDPKRYVPLSLRIYGTIKTGSAAALYEICMRYLTNINGVTNKAEVEWWRPRITGVALKDESPLEYKYFKRDVLLPAIKEINEITDIEIELLEFKTGRKITHLQFVTKAKPQQSFDLEQAMDIVDPDLMRRILAIGASAEVANKIYTDYDEDTLRETLNYVEKRIQKGGVDSPVALFRHALKKGYGRTDSEAEVATPTTKPKKAGTSQGLAAVSQEDTERLQKSNEAQAYIAALDTASRKKLLDIFAASQPAIVVEQLRKSGAKSKMVRVLLEKYVAENVLSKT